MKRPTIAISLTVKDGSKALDFYAQAFGAKESYRMPDPGGGIAHAEFVIDDTTIYLSEEAEEWSAYPMPEGGRASCLFSIEVENCDEAYQKAVAAGAQSLSEPEDQFWGARSCVIQDPFGYRWSFSQFLEEVSPEELAKRAKELFGG